MNDIKWMNICKDKYLSYIDIMSPKSNLDFVPTNLQCVFGQLIDSKDWKTTIASLCQAVIRATLPRGIISPLQIGLDVHLHHHVGFKFLIDTLNS